MALTDILKKIPDLEKSKTPAFDPAEAAKVFDELLAGGTDMLQSMIVALNDVDNGSDWKVRYCLHNLGKATHGPDRKAQRKIYLDVLAGALSGNRVDDVKIFLIQQLQWFGDETVVSKLAPLLESKNRKVFDATVATLEAIQAAEPLRTALAKTEHKTALLLVLGRLKDKASAPALRKALGDEDLEIRVAAGTAISKLVDPEATDALLKAADGATLGSFQRNRLNDAALISAENLAAAKQTEAAKKIYTHLKSTRTDEREKHVLNAASQALMQL